MLVIPSARILMNETTTGALRSISNIHGNRLDRRWLASFHHKSPAAPSCDERSLTFSSSFDQIHPRCHSTTSSQPRVWYRLLYFNTRGAAEPIRYLMAIHNVPYQDVRYPIQAAAKGFGVDETYLKHRAEGRFRANLDKVPILQVVVQQHGSDVGDMQPTVPTEIILAEIGQTHAILRFLESQHGHHHFSNPLQRAHVDAFVEGIRDVKMAWFKAKKNNQSKDFVATQLPEWCQKLEHSLPIKESASESPWLIGDHPSLADVCLYAMLAAPTSIMTGTSQSFFDGALAEDIQQAYTNCHRLRTSVAATSKIPAVQEWEARRPDTFN
jgi:glutathione S-transferase